MWAWCRWGQTPIIDKWLRLWLSLPDVAQAGDFPSAIMTILIEWTTVLIRYAPTLTICKDLLIRSPPLMGGADGDAWEMQYRDRFNKKWEPPEPPEPPSSFMWPPA